MVVVVVVAACGVGVVVVAACTGVDARLAESVSCLSAAAPAALGKEERPVPGSEGATVDLPAAGAVDDTAAGLVGPGVACIPRAAGPTAAAVVAAAVEGGIAAWEGALAAAVGCVLVVVGDGAERDQGR